jgi:hypothetical protein
MTSPCSCCNQADLLEVTRYPYGIATMWRQTEHIALTAVRSQPDAIQFVREPSPAVCRTAIDGDPTVIRYIKRQELTLDLCQYALRKDPRRVLSHLLFTEFTADCCLLYIELSGSLEDISYFFRVPAVCKAAVDRDGLQIQYVPDKYRTEALCCRAVRQTPRALLVVPRQTAAILQTAFRHHGGEALRYAINPTLLAPVLRRLIGPKAYTEAYRPVLYALTWVPPGVSLLPDQPPPAIPTTVNLNP